jgi:hypothetical protein
MLTRSSTSNVFTVMTDPTSISFSFRLSHEYVDLSIITSRCVG